MQPAEDKPISLLVKIRHWPGPAAVPLAALEPGPTQDGKLKSLWVPRLASVEVAGGKILVRILQRQTKHRKTTEVERRLSEDPPCQAEPLNLVRTLAEAEILL